MRREEELADLVEGERAAGEMRRDDCTVLLLEVLENASVTDASGVQQGGPDPTSRLS
jgi:hypothetical protein